MSKKAVMSSVTTLLKLVRFLEALNFSIWSGANVGLWEFRDY